MKKSPDFRFPKIRTSMREMGLEPTRAYTHKILSLACLPIPALPLTRKPYIHKIFNAEEGT